MGTRTSLKSERLMDALRDASEGLNSNELVVLHARLLGALIAEIGQSFIPEQRIVDAIQRARVGATEKV